MPTSRLIVSIPLASADLLYHGRYPHGDAPISGAALAGAATDATSGAAALTTSIKLQGAASDAVSATAILAGSSANLVMYSNGVLNALWPSGQDLSYSGTYPPAQSGTTAYNAGDLVSVTGVSPSQVYRCITPNTGASFP